ncbi:hypothetical protein [Microbacterium halophytorum]|uniref:hypothetical protein n=1 Tax=Microbacterium halophytorum TaxID=2067568 RepID=UPI000CFD5FC8|nr:hypothetical protein [Microbacterium halophytorum]
MTNDSDDAERADRGDAVGPLALACGVLAGVFLLIPVIGDLIAATPAVAALALGAVGIIRHERGRSRRIALAAIGAILGALVLGAIGILFVASLAQAHP